MCFQRISEFSKPNRVKNVLFFLVVLIVVFFLGSQFRISHQIIPLKEVRIESTCNFRIDDGVFDCERYFQKNVPKLYSLESLDERDYEAMNYINKRSLFNHNWREFLCQRRNRKRELMKETSFSEPVIVDVLDFLGKWWRENENSLKLVDGCSVKCEVSVNNANVVIGYGKAKSSVQLAEKNDPLFAYTMHEDISFINDVYETTLDLRLKKLVSEYEKIDIVSYFDEFADVSLQYDHLQYYLNVKEKHNREVCHTRIKEYQKKLLENMEVKNTGFLAAAFISNCGKRADSRNLYIDALSQHLEVAHFGNCWNNQPEFLGKKKLYLEKVQRSNDFKFFFAFENQITYGYVSEKLWECLMSVYVICVYFGAPDISRYFEKDVLENYKVFINALDFKSPKHLAEYLLKLNSDEKEYLEYFRWRIDGIQLNEVVSGGMSSFVNQYGENISVVCRICEYLFQKGRKVCHKSENSWG